MCFCYKMSVILTLLKVNSSVEEATPQVIEIAYAKAFPWQVGCKAFEGGLRRPKASA